MYSFKSTDYIPKNINSNLNIDSKVLTSLVIKIFIKTINYYWMMILMDDNLFKKVCEDYKRIQ